MPTAIKIRPEVFKFLKTIPLTKPFGISPLQAKIVYVRPFTSDYNLTKTTKEQTEGKQKSTSGELHPFDDIDNLILEAVRTEYPEAMTHSEFIYYEGQEEDIRKKIQYLTKEIAEIIYAPAFDNVDVLRLAMTNREFVLYTLPLDLYVLKYSEPASLVFKNEIFNAYYRLADEHLAQETVAHFRKTVIPF